MVKAETRQPFLECLANESYFKYAVYLRATVAIYGSILLWVGAWDLITESRHRPKMSYHKHNVSYYATPGEYFGVRPLDSVPAVDASLNMERWSLGQCLAYYGGGMIVTMLCDTFYTNVGMGGSYTPLWIQQSTALGYVRAAISLVATVFMWTGCYDLLSWFVMSDFVWWDVALICTGLVVMEAMGTLPCMAYCYPEEEEEHSIPDPDTSNGVSIHLVHLGRAFVTLNAQNAVWVGAYDLLENYSASTLYRELFYMMLGIALLLATGTFIGNSWIVTDFDETHGREVRASVMTQVKLLVALVGQLALNSAVWTLVDQHMWVSTDERNMAYVGVGFILLLASQAWFANAGVYVEEAEEADTQELLGASGNNDYQADDSESTPLILNAVASSVN